MQGATPESGQSQVCVGELFESNHAEKALGIWWRIVGHEQQCALADQKANSTLGCISRGMALGGGGGGGLSPLLCPHEVPPAVLHTNLGPQTQERCGAVGADTEEAIRMLRGLELLWCGERLRELEVFSLEKVLGDLTVAFQNSKEEEQGE